MAMSLSLRKDSPVIHKVDSLKVLGISLLSFLTGILIVLSLLVYLSVNSSIDSTENLKEISRSKILVLDISRTAMDIIVDRAGGRVSPERKKSIDDNFSELEKTYIRVSSRDAQHDEINVIVARIKAEIVNFKSAVLLDLPLLIEQRAPEWKYGPVDDAIDGSAERILSDLTSLHDHMSEDQAAIYNRMILKSMIMFVTSIAVFLISLVAIYQMVKFIKASIVTPFSEVSGVLTSAVSKSSESLGGSAAVLSGLSQRVVEETEKGLKHTQDVSVHIQSVSGATEQMVSSIEEIKKQTSLSSEVANLAVAESDGMSGTITQLHESSKGIGEITELIKGIAESTNLLALNATIEAARAGEAGKGFAVVATEVKNLAVKTADATEGISERVRMMQVLADSAVAAIENIRGTIRDMNEASSSVMAAIDQQSFATQSISGILRDVIRGIDVTVDVIKGVDKAAHETKDVAISVVDNATTMSDISTKSIQDIRTMLYGS